MPRPHIEFIQTQMLSWKKNTKINAPQEIKLKNLSNDNFTRASTNIIKYPAEFSINNQYHIKCDEEFFVLNGAISINNINYQAGDYGFFPAGFSRFNIRCKKETDILTFYEGNNKHIFSNDDVLYNKSKLITKIETLNADWGKATDPKILAMGVKRLGLRLDPDNGETTWLLKIEENVMDADYDNQEVHPVVEEVFVLSGEMHLPSGVLKKGAYFWRPPNISHGPVGTKKGAIGIFRSKGGPLTTKWTKEKYPVQWNAKYSPSIPRFLLKNLSLDYDEKLPY